MARHQSGRRQLICRGHGKRKFCVYVRRNKSGQIVKVTNVHRSIRRDMAVRAKRRLFLPRDRGYGFKGDF